MAKAKTITYDFQLHPWLSPREYVVKVKKIKWMKDVNILRITTTNIPRKK